MNQPRNKTTCADCMIIITGKPKAGWPECGPICYSCLLARYRRIAEHIDYAKSWELRDELAYITGRLQDIKWNESASVTLQAMLLIEKITPEPRKTPRTSIKQFKDKTRAQIAKASAERAERDQARLRRLAAPTTPKKPAERLREWAAGIAKRCLAKRGR